MKSKIYLIFFLLLIYCSTIFSYETEWVKGELLIQFPTNLSQNEIKTFLQNTKSINYAECHQLSNRLKIWQVRLNDTNANLDLEMINLKNCIPIHAIQRNHIVSLRETIPNDPEFSNQWPLLNTGENNGLIDADIDATDAWDDSTSGVTVNGDQIVVAIIDSGIDINHPDISFWKNSLEIPNNGIDDDQNGYIDDYDGWNSYDHTGQVITGSHGTHVSGIAAAIGNNNLGVSGVCWNAKVMPIAGSSNTESVVVEAYAYVLEMRAQYNETNGQAGAYVVATNASFGVDYGNPIDFPIWSAIYDSLGAVGVLSCGATANISVDVDINYDMPTACSSDFLISVTNTTKLDEKFATSGYGATTIDLGAPGTSVRSTDWYGSYSYKTGTSMASPHVTGAIAQLYSALPLAFFNNYPNDPAGLALALKTFILAGVDSLQSLQNITVTGGRLNIFNSVNLMKQSLGILNPPQNLSYSLENNYPVFNWEAPLLNLNHVFLGYNLFKNNSLVNQNLITNTTYTDSSLTNGFIYNYYVIAVYETGESVPSNNVDINLLLPPTQLSAITGDNLVILNWCTPQLNPSFCHNRELTGYNIYRDTLLINQELVTDSSYSDNTVLNDSTYTYFVTAVYSDGESISSNMITATPVEQASRDNNRNQAITSLGSNYPNPFNPSTTIQFSLKEKSMVNIDVYNIKGQLIKNLTHSLFVSGNHQILWNGQDNNNHKVGSGVYFVKMKTNTYSNIRKIILLK